MINPAFAKESDLYFFWTIAKIIAKMKKTIDIIGIKNKEINPEILETKLSIPNGIFSFFFII